MKRRAVGLTAVAVLVGLGLGKSQAAVWCWKDYNRSLPGGYMPDFDQRQVTYEGACGLFSLANSLTWFDNKSKFVPSFSWADDLIPPQLEGFTQVVDLVNELANDTLQANNLTDLPAGLTPPQLQKGVDKYLNDVNLGPNRHTDEKYFYHQLVYQPEFSWIADEVSKSEDVTLGIVFSLFVDQDKDGTGDKWFPAGGHAVTVAGVNSNEQRVGISDPIRDVSEGATGGENDHVHPEGNYIQHNNPLNVSHDIYDVLQSDSPWGKWRLNQYKQFDELTIPSGCTRTRVGNGPDGQQGTEDDIWNYRGPNFDVNVVLVRTEIGSALKISPIPEPSTLIIWSLLGGLGFTVGWRRRRRAA